jgi:hypothetical protein
MGFHFFSPNKLFLTVFFGLIFLPSGIYAQNIKKVYRNLKKDKLEKVSEEMIDFEDETTSTLDTKLWEIALAIVVNHKDFEKYDPYKAYSLFEDVVIATSQKKEIQEFLADYDFTLPDIKKEIHKNILEIARSGNGEKDYEKALSVCENCFYKLEVIKLKELAAYQETIAIDTKFKYEYYLQEYPDGQHYDDILNLLTKKEFELAKKSQSIREWEAFINKYPSSKFNDQALYARDSLILFRTPKTFADYSSFLKNYPSSQFAPKIKKQLPDLLYDEAIKSETIDGYKRFLTEFPKDERTDKILNLLENAFVNSIRTYPRLPDIRDFKNHFPNSIELDWIVKTSDSLISNSDWKRLNLKGEVKEITFDAYSYGNSNASLKRLKKIFDPSGRMITLEYEKSKSEKIYQIESEINPVEFDHETQIFTNFGILNPPYELRSEIKKSTDNDDKKYVLNYSTNGLKTVFRVENESNSGKQFGKDAFQFFYNKDGNLTSRLGESYDVYYSWENEKLISKKIYTKNSKFVGEYVVTYPGNQLQISLKSTGSTQLDISYKFDSNGRIIERKVQEKKESYSVPVRTYTVSNFKYDNKDRVISVSSIEFALNYDETLYYPKRKEDIRVNRDVSGNIIKYLKTVKQDQSGELQVNELYGEEMEWEYTYDETGNWNSRTEFSLKNGSKKLENKVVRDIEYHKAETVNISVSYIKTYQDENIEVKSVSNKEFETIPFAVVEYVTIFPGCENLKDSSQQRNVRVKR